MSSYFTMWLLICAFALLVNVTWTDECSHRLLEPIPRNVNLPTHCVMNCTMKTYVKKQLLQHRPSIQFQDSREGDDGGHCWSRTLKCRIGESFDRAFVVLPVNIAAAEEVEVSTSPGATKLEVHPPLSLISDSCGLLYEVTEQFKKENSQSSFCIQLSSGAEVLRCPPYLVIFWKTDSNQVHQQSGG